MKREMFVRVATAELRSQNVPDAERLAEAIARRMDIVAEALGEGAAAGASVVEMPRPAFPMPNPQAAAPLPQAADAYRERYIPMPAPLPDPIHTDPTLFSQTHIPPDPNQGASLIIPATRIPDSSEIAAMKQRQERQLVGSQPPAGRMKVEELSQLIQERTPNRLVFDVPTEDGGTRRVSFVRNVISMHANDAVQLVYYPPNAPLSAREATEVQQNISIDDLPIDVTQVLNKLMALAIDSLRPRRPVVSLPPMPASGPVTHAADNYQDPTQNRNIQTVFNSI